MNELPWAVYILTAGLTGVIMAAGGFVVREIATRGAAGKLERNGYAGLRTKATMASDQAWLAAHIAGKADSLRAGQVLIVSSGVGFALPAVLGLVGVLDAGPALILWTIVLIASVFVVLWFMFRAMKAANRAARATE